MAGKLIITQEKNYVVGSKAYVVELNLLLNREASYTIVQAFEAFSTFLKDIIGAFLYLNPSKNNAYIKDVKINSTLEYYKVGMRRFNAGRNNKEIFKLLRSTSPVYAKGEEANEWGLNPYDWYQAYAVVRHSIVHSAGIIKKSNKDYIDLSDLQRRIMAKLFLAENDPTAEVIYICVDVAGAEKAIEMLSEYAFLIFKSLSMEMGGEWRVLKGQ